MITYECKIRVRYGETDQMGFLYHARYVDYYDVARTEMLCKYDSSNKELEESSIMLPALKVESNYRSPAYYDELLTVKVSLKEMPSVKMKFDYEIYRESGELINTASVTLAFMNSTTKRACRPPEWFLKLLEPFFG